MQIILDLIARDAMRRVCAPLGVALVCAVIFASSAHAYDVPESVLKGKISGACITIEEQFIGFGEESTRADALRKLDEAIAILRVRRPSFAQASEKSRAASCSVYIKWMNEFDCTATATLCR